MVRLATGSSLQATVTNTGDAVAQEHGTPVQVQVPPDALRVLGGADAGTPGDGVRPEAEPATA
jgi:hypothetical protein